MRTSQGTMDKETRATCNKKEGGHVHSLNPGTPKPLNQGIQLQLCRDPEYGL